MRSQTMENMENERPKTSSTAGKTTSTMAMAARAGILTSSPPRSPSTRSQTAKETRKASITPRKFQRFFTPRSRVSSQPTSASSRALRNLTASALNRCQTPSSPLEAISEDRIPDHVADMGTVRASKRRRVQHTTPKTSPMRPDMSSLNSSPPMPDMLASPSNRRRQLLSPIRSIQGSQDVTDSEDMTSEDDELPTRPAPVNRTLTLPSRGFAAQLLTRMTGGVPRAGHQLMRSPVADWRTETADFYSRPEDVHSCTSNEGPGRCIPFSVASCNTNSLVAVGDEEGYVRLLDSNDQLGKTHISFPTHNNAIIDMAFSEDDRFLATASGDQTGRVYDMATQTPIAQLHHHTASLKQVRFQPGRGSGSVLATSSRDGSIHIWDLRCRNGAPPVLQVPDQRLTALVFRGALRITAGCVVNSMYGAHAHPPQHRYQTRHNPALNSNSILSPAATTSTDVGSRGEAPGRIGEVSVTALQFLHPGQEHLLLSASEADATIKLWDVRSIQTGSRASSHQRHYPTPVSFARQPDSHVGFRPFGVSALALSGDGGRLYSLCKDNTVYAYSTAHLVLGHAPELSRQAGSEPPRRSTKQPVGGLGPLYGFRHPSFYATSFYTKAAVRPARDGRPEMLAVGSSDGSPVVFPTDERYFRRDMSVAARGVAPPNGMDERGGVINLAGGMMDGDASAARRRPGGGLVRTNSITGLSARLNDTVPVYKPYGTALVRGHEKEVGALTWTRDGKLVTVGDDYTVRCWGEDREEASDLRRGGEVNGRRWRCGWADVGEGWEGDDDGW